MSEKLFKEISNYGIVPVIQINRVEDAIPLAKALIDGGLPVAEVTFRTDCAEEAIRQMANEFPEMLVGAGTVLTVEQLDLAVAAGTKFIVSPGLNPKIVKYCQSINIPIIPGTASPSDLELAIELGLDTVKFFPAEVNGGINAINAMSAPYGQLKFMPTGGVNENNLMDYLSSDKILACGGTWMVKSDLIDNKQFDTIRDLTRLAVKKMLDIKLDHVGIKNADIKNDQDIQLLKKLLMTEENVTSEETTVGEVKFISDIYNDQKGDLAFSCSNVDRAVFHLEKTGVNFDHDTAVYNNGNLKLIYIKDSVAGYAIHLLRK